MARRERPGERAALWGAAIVSVEGRCEEVVRSLRLVPPEEGLRFDGSVPAADRECPAGVETREGCHDLGDEGGSLGGRHLADRGHRVGHLRPEDDRVGAHIEDLSFVERVGVHRLRHASSTEEPLLLGGLGDVGHEPGEPSGVDRVLRPHLDGRGDREDHRVRSRPETRRRVLVAHEVDVAAIPESFTGVEPGPAHLGCVKRDAPGQVFLV